MTAVGLPDGRLIEGGIDQNGCWTDAPPTGAEWLPGRYALAGLVDAHCHLSIAADDAAPTGSRPLSLSRTRRNLQAAQQAGITLVRDMGSPMVNSGAVTLQLSNARDGAGLLAAGRFLAPPGGYLAGLFEPVTAEDLVQAARVQVAAGTQWVKLIGDFPDIDHGVTRPDQATPNYPIEAVRRLVRAVHAEGARVAAHTTTTWASDLVAAGVDSIEHGDALTGDDLEALAARGGAWTPTLCASLAPAPADDPGRRRRLAQRRERLTHLLAEAARHQVTVLAGTDVVGNLPNEVRLLTELGLTPQDALAAASSKARRYLLPNDTNGDFNTGEPANLVTYHHDPRNDPDILGHPAATFAAGRRIQ
ncbi:amidohydrolase family protein [Actinomadura sp. NAK00032]|uniref:amidohydrolase family protein n=1 Tax=Actinomadura sp. NAK00032 TaxID=2742128 RepID=UPI00159277E7|nr:amidohydrolase family protein [Actinomadura sp. NAK00032]QKW32985.1 amidohydrolase family protein [Actinomadura sp. NAK00032]